MQARQMCCFEKLYSASGYTSQEAIPFAVAIVALTCGMTSARVSPAFRASQTTSYTITLQALQGQIPFTLGVKSYNARQ